MNPPKMRGKSWATFLALLFIHAAIHRSSAADQTEKMRDDTALAINAPKPDYPYEARRRRQTGSGVAELQIDSSSGKVTHAEMVQSTGVAILDNATLTAFRQ